MQARANTGSPIVARNVERRRKALGLTRAQLADRVNVSPIAVYFWETAARGISGAKLPQVAEALGCSVGDLFAPE